MNYYSFRQSNESRGCFSVHGLADGSAAALSSNLSRWCAEEKLVKLRNGWYAFPNRVKSSTDRMFVANSIYAPSYISLFTALSYYEMIPEAVTAINSVTTLKTAEFRSKAGLFSYHSIKPEMFFGYNVISGPGELPFKIATPEKTLVDLLYLYPEYNTTEGMEDLRLDEDFMREEFHWDTLQSFLQRIGSRALEARFELITEIYR